MKNLKYLLNTSISLIMSICLYGCNNLVGNITGNITPSGLNIDAVATVPVIGNSTQFPLTIRNNSTNNISNIIFSVKNNNSIYGQSTQIIDPASSSKCTQLSAGNLCTINLNTPNFDVYDTQASFTLIASYTQDNYQYQVSRVINYKNINEIPVTKLQTSTDINVLTDQYSSNIGQTIFIYNTESASYNVNDITLANGTIVANNIGTIIPNSVIPVTLNLTQKQLKNSPQLYINAKNQAEQIQSFTATLTTIQPIINQPYLLASLPSSINTAISESGSLILSNISNNTIATSISASGTNGIVITSSCNSLSPNGSCTISYTIPNSPKSGSGNITISYLGGNNLSVPINWYNTQSGSMFSMSASNSTMTPTQGVATINNITITNIGTYPTSSSGITFNVNSNSGNAIISESNNTCQNVSIKVNGSCTVSVIITDNSIESSQIFNLVMSTTTNGSTYSRLLNIGYNSIHSNNYYAYVASNKYINTYSYESSNGNLTSIQSINALPISNARPGDPVTVQIKIDPLRRYLYLVSTESNTILSYNINPTTGMLSQQASITSLSSPIDIAFDASGRYAYVAGSNGIKVFAIESNGLTPIAMTSITYGISAITADSTGKYIYAITINGIDSPQILMFSIGTNGNLTAIGTPFNMNSGLNTVRGISATKNFVYAINFDGNSTSAITSCIESSNGILACSNGASVSGQYFTAITTDTTGKYVYVPQDTNIGGSSGITSSVINSTTGTLTKNPNAHIGYSAAMVVMAPFNQYVYLASPISNRIVQLSAGNATQSPQPLGTVVSAPVASAIVFY